VNKSVHDGKGNQHGGEGRPAKREGELGHHLPHQLRHYCPDDPFLFDLLLLIPSLFQYFTGNQFASYLTFVELKRRELQSGAADLPKQLLRQS